MIAKILSWQTNLGIIISEIYSNHQGQMKKINEVMYIYLFYQEKEYYN
jgi:hypothetical protein